MHYYSLKLILSGIFFFGPEKNQSRIMTTAAEQRESRLMMELGIYSRTG